MIRRGAAPDSQMLSRVEQVLMSLDAVLERNKYVAGEHLTIADYSLVATVSTMEVGEPGDTR